MDKWDERFMKMTWTIAEWSSCFRKGRSIGCVIVKDGEVVGSGHNMIGAGISFALDKVVKPVGNAAANAEVKALQAENAEIKAQLEELKAVVESMKTAAK